MQANYFISAYTTSPSMQQWQPEKESQYFQGLADDSQVIGIEHPFSSDSGNYPIAWLLQNIPEHWSIILTSLPAFMQAQRLNPWLGLASVQEEGRQQAVNMMEAINRYAQMLNQQFGRRIVKAIHFHALPSRNEENNRGDKAALAQSLREMQALDWQGVALNLEHCDAYIPHQTGEKRFLTLDDELAALAEVGGYGMVLNWARSAIEGRSVQTPLQHIAMAKQANLLQGFFFSGCSDNPESAYGVWRDTHMPPNNSIDGRYLPGDDGLLGDVEIAAVLKALEGCEEPVYRGVKVLDKSNSDAVDVKVGLNRETIALINRFDHNLK